MIVLPTDTVYGIAADLGNPDAVRRIFEIKRRPGDKPLPVLVAGMQEAIELGRFSGDARAAALAGWPGALTVVVPAMRPLPQLGGDGSSVGLRVPDHPFALALLKKSGPLAATSANRSGQPAGSDLDDLRRILKDEVDLYIDGGELQSAPSRVVSYIGPRRVLRQ